MSSNRPFLTIKPLAERTLRMQPIMGERNGDHGYRVFDNRFYETDHAVRTVTTLYSSIHSALVGSAKRIEFMASCRWRTIEKISAANLTHITSPTPQTDCRFACRCDFYVHVIHARPGAAPLTMYYICLYCLNHACTPLQNIPQRCAMCRQGLYKDLTEQPDYGGKIILFCWEHKEIHKLVRHFKLTEDDLLWGADPQGATQQAQVKPCDGSVLDEPGSSAFHCMEHMLSACCSMAATVVFLSQPEQI